MISARPPCSTCHREIIGRKRGNMCNSCGLKFLRERRRNRNRGLSNSSRPVTFELLQQESRDSTFFLSDANSSSPDPAWGACLRRLAQKWHQAELVLRYHFPGHGKLLASSRGASGSEPAEPELSRMEAAVECWKQYRNSNTCIARATTALIDTISDVEHMAALAGDLVIACTQGGALVSKWGILHIMIALGKALNCADHERGDIECVRLSDVEEAVRSFETERYLADNWERDETLMEYTRLVKDKLDCTQSDVLFSNLVAGCRTLCTDYRQASWVVARAITESNIGVTGDVTSASLILAIRKSRFGSHGLASSSRMQYHVIIDVPICASGGIEKLVPWSQVTDTGQILCGSRIGGWYVKWSRTVRYRGQACFEYSGLSQEEAVAMTSSNRTLIKNWPSYVRTTTSLSVDVVCKLGWFVLNGPTLLQELYKEVAEDSDLPDPKRLGTRVIDCLREWDLYEAIGEQRVTERSISGLVIDMENVRSWARAVVQRCLLSIGGGGVVVIRTNESTLHCTSSGSPMVDGQKALPGSGFFLEHDGHTTPLKSKQGILEAIAPIHRQTQINFLLYGIHAVCDQLSGFLNITPDFSALQDLGDFSYRRRLQLVPGAYYFHRGRLDEEEAVDLRKNWLWFLSEITV